MYLDSLPDDVRRAEGSVESFECKGPAVLVHLKVADREMVFLIKDPKEIVVRNRDSETFDLTCGPATLQAGRDLPAATKHRR